jgi:hypothetical protein
MSKPPTLYLILDTSSSNEHDNGECDWSLIPLLLLYVNELIQYRNLVSFLYRADQQIYNLESWDATPWYFRDNDQFGNLKDIDGQPVGDIPRGEPIILNQDPEIAEDDFQRVDCQTVQVSREDVWWTAYVKHTNIRIETAHISYKVLERILRQFHSREKHPRKRAPAELVHPGLHRIYDLLYLDTREGRQFYNRDKAWDADTLAEIAAVVSQHLPLPQTPSKNR